MSSNLPGGVLQRVCLYVQLAVLGGRRVCLRAAGGVVKEAGVPTCSWRYYEGGGCAYTYSWLCPAALVCA